MIGIDEIKTYFPGEPEKEYALIISKQIFFDRDCHLIHCYLWIGKDIDSNYKQFVENGYIMKRQTPMILRVNTKHKLLIRCVQSRAGYSYYIGYHERTVNLRDLQSDEHLEIIFRIDPPPDEILEKFMDIDCQAIMNEDTKFTPLRLRSDQGNDRRARKIDIQIIGKDDDYCIHCCFHIADENEWADLRKSCSREKGYRKVIHAAPKDNIHVFLTKASSKQSYNIYNNEVNVNVQSLILNGFLEHIFRIDPGPDYNKEDGISFLCNIRINGESTQSSPPIRFTRKAGAHGNPTANEIYSRLSNFLKGEGGTTESDATEESSILNKDFVDSLVHLVASTPEGETTIRQRLRPFIYIHTVKVVKQNTIGTFSDGGLHQLKSDKCTNYIGETKL